MLTGVVSLRSLVGPIGLSRRRIISRKVLISGITNVIIEIRDYSVNRPDDSGANE
ncbi:MAG: hypothetical protein SFW07_02425 [Gammaproteobacteria bacterium]|nr:hypothetical protein [Gammaproteobacteria bacterium]